MGNHVDNRNKVRKQKNFSEDTDARRRRIGFKQYLRQLEEQLEDEYEEGDDYQDDYEDNTDQGD